MTAAVRPILFSDAMVRALLAGTKTQTRRVIQAPARNMQRAGMCVIKSRETGHPWYGDHVWSMRGSMGVWGDYTDEQFRSLCPYGLPGDRLWVREAWGPLAGGVTYRATAFTECPDGARWRPSIHMPRWASRLTLEVTDVRVERLQSISEDDARAEGVTPFGAGVGGDQRVPGRRDDVTQATSPHVVAFASLWDSINGERSGCSWGDDPWVWAVSFRRVEVER